MRLRLFAAAILLWSAVACPVSAQGQDGAPARWTIEDHPVFGNTAVIHGNVNWGDQLYVRVVGDSCNEANVIFNAYSYYKGSDFKQLTEKTVGVTFNGADRNARILLAEPFLLGHMAFFDLGLQDLDVLLKDLTKGQEITAAYGAGQLEKFFDMPNNSWNTAGLTESVAELRRLCAKPEAAATPGEPADCDQLVTTKAWIGALTERREEGYLAELKQCMAGREDIQLAVDTMVIAVVGELASIPASRTALRRSLASFAKKTMHAAAEAGFPSSQHNYATFHNLPPADPLNAELPPDHKVFMHWTRKAAAQQEPRALFNLSQRLMHGQSGEKQDLQTAYILLRRIPDIMESSTATREIFGSLLDEQLEILRSRLGPDGVEAADALLPGFDFASLAPR